MITKWLHLNELGGDPWVLPIWTAVNEAVKSRKTRPLSSEVYRAGLHVSIRLNILPRVVERVNDNTLLLYKKIREHGPEHVFTQAREAYAFSVDDDLKYSLVADIDALLFELNSACDLMKRFFGLLYVHVGRPIPQKQLGKAIHRVLTGDTQNGKWFLSLDKHRNFFTHEGAPHIAVDLSGEPGTLDLLIMKENVKTFANPDTFVSLSEVNRIVQGFVSAKRRLQDHLVSLFR